MRWIVTAVVIVALGAVLGPLFLLLVLASCLSLAVVSALFALLSALLLAAKRIGPLAIK